MLSMGEVHNMGLARGFRPESLYGRDSYGLETAALDAASGNAMFQEHLNDLISNSFQPLPQQQQCTTSSYGSQPGGDLYTSMGFSQSDNFLLDDLPPVADHSHLPFSRSTASYCPISPLQGVQPPPPPTPQWVDDKLALLSPARGLKRDLGIDQMLPQQQPRKKPDRSARTVGPKNKRPGMEQAGDHILRERQRRDDMTSKFAVLESLLPIGVKRDRSTIVDDSIEYVKNLHHRIKSLQERKVEMNQSKAATTRKGPIVPLNGAASSPGKELLPEAGAAAATPSVLSRRARLSDEQMSGVHDVLRSCLERMEVHDDLPHQVVIEMVCRPQPRLQSNILLCMESLKLDVLQCSITKIAHRLICVITAKPQGENSSGVVAALKKALQQ